MDITDFIESGVCTSAFPQIEWKKRPSCEDITVSGFFNHVTPKMVLNGVELATGIGWKRIKLSEGPKIEPERVIFHAPATIVYWNDGTKTVVKCDPRDTYSQEAGLALCYMKKALGSSRAFNDVLKEWVDNA